MRWQTGGMVKATTPLDLRRLTGAALDARLGDLARLRISVFRAFPYLYEGDLEYERSYLQHFAEAADAVIIGAFSGDSLVGCATGSALKGHHEEFSAPLEAAGIDLETTFYFGESVLEPAWRGTGVGHRFFDLREAWAREQGYRRVSFCAVCRPPDHPACPAGYTPLDEFWRRRGYRPMPGLIAHFSWRDVGAAEDTSKPMQVWMKALTG